MPNNNTATNVTTGKPNPSGSIYVAPLGTALPTDASSALGDAFKCLGFVSEDGLHNSNEINVSDIKAWGGLIVYSSLDEFTDTFKFNLLETLNTEVLKAVYGDSNVTVDASGNVEISVNANCLSEKVWVFDLALRGDVSCRIVVADGIITARDEIAYTDSDAVAYGVTVTAYASNAISNNTHKEYRTPSGVSM